MLRQDTGVEGPSTLGRRTFPSALELGPRKKPYVLLSSPFIAALLNSKIGPQLTPSLDTVGILGAPSTPSAECTPSSRTASFGRTSLLTALMIHLPQSELSRAFLSFSNSLVDYREQREYRIYKQLLQMVPGLEERIVNCSAQGLVHIADLVSA